MFSFREFWHRLQFLLFHDGFDRELAEEINDHVERMTQENISRGMPPAEARSAALRHFGNTALQQERSREHWSFPALDSFLQDIRFGARLMLKAPLLTTIAIATLALGIGANAAVFALVKSAFWRNFPFFEPDRLAILWASNQKTGWKEMQVSVPDVADLKAQSHSLQWISGYTWTDYQVFSVSSAGGALRVRGVAVLPNLLATLGLHPALGRDFRFEEFAASSNHVALLANTIWRTRFGADQQIVGKTVRINREPFFVAGVLPANFELPDLGKAPEVLVPLALDSPEAHKRSQRILLPLGRLKAGVSRAAAVEELHSIARQLARDYAKEDGDYSLNLQWVSEDPVDRDARDKLPIFLATVALVLFIAASNVVLLTISRLVARTHELAMRTALGASRRRVLRQMMTEAVLLAAIAALFAALLAGWFLQLIMFYKPFYMYEYDARIGLSGMLGIAALALAIGLIVGIVPILRSGKDNVQQLLGRVGVHATGSKWQHSMRRGLVAFEISICVGLLAAAGLMLQTIQRINAIDLGFNPRNLVLARMTLDGTRYRSPEASGDFYRELVSRLRVQSRFESVTAISHSDFVGYDMAYPVDAQGEPAPLDPTTFPLAGAHVVIPGYFRDAQSPILRGREFSEHESQPAIILNQTLAKKLFRDDDPVGRIVVIGQAPQAWDESIPPGPRLVIGVVADVQKYSEFLKKVFPQFYVPLEQNPVPSMFVMVRSADSEGAIAAIRETASSMDSELAVYWATSMQSKIDEWYAGQHFQAIVLTCFAGLALSICLSGLYAVISHSVSRRSAELGVRLALGADPRSAVLLIMREGLLLIGAGTILGLGLAAALGRLLQHLLFQVRPTSVPSLAVAVFAVGTTALAATYLPSRRAARIDPVTALRAF
ncbi:MAG: ABC transporter permease [Acidobacteria bacterium]|nr:ABC transporter permease [Acidobacteriota bacterium]